MKFLTRLRPRPVARENSTYGLKQFAFKLPEDYGMELRSLRKSNYLTRSLFPSNIGNALASGIALRDAVFGLDG
jgi:hypothetical protein